MEEILCRCREARENDFEQIAGLFRRSNYGLQKIEWVQWKYRHNPDGPARVFIIENDDGELIGLRAYIPRLFESRKTVVFHATKSVDNTALWLGNSPKSVSIKPILRFEKDCDLDPKFIHGVHSATYLNSGFIDNPTQDFSACKFCDGDQSIGYCVYSPSGTACHIYDLVLSGQKRACFRLCWSAAVASKESPICISQVLDSD